jgi:hypothetical protein
MRLAGLSRRCASFGSCEVGDSSHFGTAKWEAVPSSDLSYLNKLPHLAYPAVEWHRLHFVDLNSGTGI